MGMWACCPGQFPLSSCLRQPLPDPAICICYLFIKIWRRRFENSLVWRLHTFCRKHFTLDICNINYIYNLRGWISPQKSGENYEENEKLCNMCPEGRVWYVGWKTKRKMLLEYMLPWRKGIPAVPICTNNMYEEIVNSHLPRLQKQKDDDNELTTSPVRCSPHICCS